MSQSLRFFFRSSRCPSLQMWRPDLPNNSYLIGITWCLGVVFTTHSYPQIPDGAESSRTLSRPRYSTNPPPTTFAKYYTRCRTSFYRLEADSRTDRRSFAARPPTEPERHSSCINREPEETEFVIGPPANPTFAKRPRFEGF